MATRARKSKRGVATMGDGAVVVKIMSLQKIDVRQNELDRKETK